MKILAEAGFSEMALPMAESLDLPERFGPASLTRIVDREDRARAEDLVARCESELDLESSSFHSRSLGKIIAWLFFTAFRMSLGVNSSTACEKMNESNMIVSKPN